MSKKEMVLTVTLDPRFTRLLERQNQLQQFLLGQAPADLESRDKAQYIRDQALALNVEVAEVLEETHWKPWATPPANGVVVPDKVKFSGEMADVFIFFMNLMLAGEMTMSELDTVVQAKQEKNLQRWLNGYDAKGSKCPGCKRAYDDEGVGCFSANDGKLAWCADREEYLTETGQRA